MMISQIFEAIDIPNFVRDIWNRNGQLEERQRNTCPSKSKGLASYPVNLSMLVDS